MEKSFEQLNRQRNIASDKKSQFDIVKDAHKEVLDSESYEDVAESLGEIEALQNFREKLKEFPFGSFFSIFEDITNINKSLLSQEKKDEQIKFLIERMEQKVNRFSPRVADLYLAILSEIKKEPYVPDFETIEEKMLELKQNSDFYALFSKDISWEIKLNRIEKRLVGYLSGIRAIDKREGAEMDDDIWEWRENELKKAPTHPPKRNNKSKPRMDEMEQLKEGEKVSAIWSISPAYGGYFRKQSFSHWDSNRNTWTEDAYEYSDVDPDRLCEKEEPLNEKTSLSMRACVYTNEWISLPVPYTHSVYKIEAGKDKEYQIKKDQNGDIIFIIKGEKNEEVEANIVLVPDSNKVYGPFATEDIKVPEMPAKFFDETEEAIEKIAQEKQGNISRAEAIALYTIRRLVYSNESKYNVIYDNYEGGYPAAIDEHKKADCDVANTYFAALCVKLDIPVRHCVGHSVKGKDENNSSNINSGTGHAWSEVWDERKNEWIRIDATPSGDPNLEEEDQTGGGEDIPGDYGNDDGREANKQTDEQLEELRKTLSEYKEELAYTKEERSLAKMTGIEFKEARQIVREIKEAENTCFPNGKLVTDTLSLVFNSLVESRKTTVQDYDGHFRRQEGGEGIKDIVRHKIGILAGETDPSSRNKTENEGLEEKLFGGFDVYIIGDKSGSMRSEVGGEAIWKMQRQSEYLILSVLHRFERNIERAGLQKEKALSARTQEISFRGSGPEDIDLDKPLSKEFTPKDKVNLWHSLTKGGSSNGDVAALSYVYEQIKDEIEKIEKSGAKDNRLRIVIACSDGGPDDPATLQKRAEDIGKMGAVVVGIGLTETAASVPIIYDTSYSRGDIARDVNDLPSIVAKHIVLQAVKLFPEKAREDAMQIIKNAINT